MSNHYSIYPKPELKKALDDRVISAADNNERDGAFRGKSATITAVCTRYIEAVRQYVPDFTVSEWLMICDSLKWHWSYSNPEMAAYCVSHNVADKAVLTNANEHFGVDGFAIARRISDMSFIEQIAIMDVSEKFWAGRDNKDESYEALFERLTGRQLPSEKRAGPKSRLELAVEQAAKTAYRENTEMTVGRIQGVWSVAYNEDLKAQGDMEGPTFIVTANGIKAREAVENLKTHKINFYYNNEARVYSIGEDLITIEVFPSEFHGKVVINQRG